VEDDLHLYRRGDERHQVEAELDGCCLVVEELDGHLAQCELLVRSAQQALLMQKPAARQVLLAALRVQ
jgi:hypothetical protein